MKHTLRLNYPQWQGGMNHDYHFGQQVLAAIVPPSPTTPTFTVPVSLSADADSTIDARQTLQEQMHQADAILTREQPERVITIGGDCSVSQVPFDYLHRQYPDHFGIIWLDAHPDVAGPKTSHHLHEMVLANLMGQNPADTVTTVQAPVAPDDVFLAGLQVADLRPMDQLATDLHIATATPEMLADNSDAVKQWLQGRDIQHVAVHFDLDALDPADYRSILPAKPGLNPADFGAAIGAMTLTQATRLLRDVSTTTDLVGLTLAEHMPWDALNLRHSLSQLPLFE